MKYVNFWFDIYIVCVWQHGNAFAKWETSEEETLRTVLYWERLRDYSLARYHVALHKVFTDLIKS